MSEEQGADSTDPLAKFASIIEPLKEKYDGRVAAFPVGKFGVLVVRRATGTELRYFTRKLQNFERTATQATEARERDAALELSDQETVDFVVRVTAHPIDTAQTRAILEEYPAMLPQVSRAINRISGGGVDELGKA